MNKYVNSIWLMLIDITGNVFCKIFVKKFLNQMNSDPRSCSSSDFISAVLMIYFIYMYV